MHSQLATGSLVECLVCVDIRQPAESGHRSKEYQCDQDQQNEPIIAHRTGTPEMPEGAELRRLPQSRSTKRVHLIPGPILCVAFLYPSAFSKRCLALQPRSPPRPVFPDHASASGSARCVRVDGS
jgi:hypothetical protein